MKRKQQLKCLNIKQNNLRYIYPTLLPHSFLNPTINLSCRNNASFGKISYPTSLSLSPPVYFRKNYLRVQSTWPSSSSLRNLTWSVRLTDPLPTLLTLVLYFFSERRKKQTKWRSFSSTLFLSYYLGHTLSAVWILDALSVSLFLFLWKEVSPFTLSDTFALCSPCVYRVF